MALLLLAGGVAGWRAFHPGRAMASQVKNPAFRHWYATLETEKEKSEVAATLDAYSLAYGSKTWVRHVEEELEANGKPRYYDLVELAMALESARDRAEMLDGHEVSLALLSYPGATESLGQYVDDLKRLRAQGGKTWRAAKSNPMAVGIRRATQGAGQKGEELWEWYLDNHEWCNDYLCNIHWEGDEAEPDAFLRDALRELAHRPKVYRNLHREVTEAVENDADEDEGFRELTPGDFLAASMSTVAQFGGVFDVLAKGEVPLVEALDVMANNIADLSAAHAFDNAKACHDTGVELATIHRLHHAVWDVAAGPNGEGVIRFYHEVPAHAEAVLDAFGEEGVIPFLREYYASPELLSVAAEVLARYEMAGWAALCRFRDNSEFKRALLTEGVGHLVVPYIAFHDDGKGGDVAAIGKCLKDPDWVKCYLDQDGRIKEDEATFWELLPCVGGIATVLKHQLRGEPVTMAEIGWAAFDVVDTVVTVAAIVGTFGAATPAAAAKEAAKETAKQGCKKVIQQGGKQLARRGARYVLREGAEDVSKSIIRQQAKSQIRRSLWRRVLTASARATVRTVQFAGRTVKMAVRPVVAVGKAWNKLPVQVKKNVLRGVAGAMMFVVLTQRTLPRLPGYLEKTIGDMGTYAGRIVNAVGKGAADAMTGALKEVLGVGTSADGGAADRIVSVVVMVGALAGFLLLLKRKKGPPVRVA